MIADPRYQNAIESIVDGHYRSTTSEQKQLFSLEEVKALAENLMDDCRLNKAPFDPISTLSFQIQPVVAAGKAFAYSLRDTARLEENRIDFSCGFWTNPGLMKACARLCTSLIRAVAGDWNDDKEYWTIQIQPQVSSLWQMIQRKQSISSTPWHCESLQTIGSLRQRLSR